MRSSAMAFSVFGILVIGVFLAATVLWIYTLVDSLQIPDHTWHAAGQNKLLWILLIVFLGFLGSILYMLIPRPSLKAMSG